MDAMWTMSPCGGVPPSAAVGDDESAAAELRRGPWTSEEDAVLSGHVAAHGEGRWNELAVAAGLRRTGKSCRLRWLNYLRPGVRRGGFTPREQLLILDLHSRWGNRWSKIASHLPGRTDNEVKNYWRTRVQKHAKQLGCDVGSRRFHDVVRNLWMPRLVERVHADDSAAAAAAASQHYSASPAPAACQNVAAAPATVGNCSVRAPSPDATSCVTGSSSSSSWEASPPPAAQFQTSSPPAVAAGWAATTDQCQQNGCSSSATSGGDMFDESWSELLARANHDGAESAGLPDFGLGETGDNWWSLDDIILQQPLY